MPRRSRFALARLWLWRRLKQSAFGRRCGEIYERLYEWWYPVLDDPYPYYGYYGRKRKSRPVVLWRKFKRWVRNSWLGQRYREWLYRFEEWWYPPLQAADAPYPHYQHRRLSRPVLAYRRWHRWFRKTWVGREFGWILDEVHRAAVVPSVRGGAGACLAPGAAIPIEKQTIAALVVLVLAAVAGYQIWQAALPPLCGDGNMPGRPSSSC